FDIVTQHGAAWLDNTRCHGCAMQTRRARITERVSALALQRPVREADRLAIIAEVVSETSAPRWQQDVRRRRLTIVSGRGMVHGRAFELERDFGLTDRSWESSGPLDPPQSTPVAPSRPVSVSPVPLRPPTA